MTVKDDAIKVVDQYWRSAVDIHARVGCWSGTGVRHALNQLASEHLVEMRAIPIQRGGNVRYEYRLPRGEKVA